MTPVKKTTNHIVESIKKGFADMKLVAEEGNFKLFLKQLVVLILLFLAFRSFNTKLEAQSSSILDSVSALQAQRQNEAEYLANKKKLLDLEPRFPSISEKNDWLLRKTIAVFRESNLEPKMTSTQKESNNEAAYTVVTLPISIQASYDQLGHLIANIENRDEYLRISDFSLSKKSEPLGMNDVSVNINTIFPSEKIAPKLFKETAGE